MTMTKTIVMLISLAGLVAAGLVAADEPPPPSAFNRPVPRRGRDEYARYCVWCHGQDGDGRGVSWHYLNPQPRDFRPANFKCRTTPSGALPTDEDLRTTLRAGLHGTAMPAWAALSALQIEDLVDFIKQYSPRWTSETAPAPIVVPPEPPNDEASVRRGEQVYRRAGCFNCHGYGGHGNGPALAALRDDSGNPIEAADFTKEGALKCGDSPARIYTTFMTGLNGTPMPSFADSLSATDAWDLTHFVLALKRRR
jgi:cytochrome c oxidase cbb3-type subunit 2